MTEEERDDLRNVLAVLEPFEISSKRLESPSACLFDTVQSIAENMRQVSKVVRTNNLAKEFEKVYMAYSLNSATTVAAGLMAAPFMYPNWAEGQTASNCRCFTNALVSLSQKMFGEHAPEPDVLRDEAAMMFDGRLMSPVRGRATTSLDDWWFKAQHEAPFLYDVFLRVRVTTSSEADAERAYSDIGRIHTLDRNNMLVGSIESCLLVSKLQDWRSKLGVEQLQSSFFVRSPGKTWKDALAGGSFPLDQYAYFNVTERSMVGRAQGKQLAQGQKVKLWFVGHARPTLYTVREVIGDKYKGGPNHGLESGNDKGCWTLSEGGKISQHVLDDAEDEWEMVMQ